MRIPFFTALAAVTLAAATVPIPGDAARGAALFQSQKCIVCHSVQGEGGGSAPDLGKRSARAYTPSLLASLMWNHAPVMWRALEQAGIAKPQLDTQQAADLYAYLYAFRYFEKPGDAGRGRQYFYRKACADCHSLDPGGTGTGPAVSSWAALTDSIALSHAMWTHGPQMYQAMTKNKIDWPRISAQELTDLMVYLRNLPDRKPGQEAFSPAPPESGESLFQSKGCSGCHQGSLRLDARLRSRTMTDFAASMWNHSPKMLQLPPSITLPDMRMLVGYLWSIQFFEDPGNARRGESTFRKKGCAQCHEGASPTAPSLAGRGPVNSISLVSVLWKHGPAMIEQMIKQNIAWPRFKDSEMADLAAYLNQKR
ncbi:MAG: c-type cytochrome [Acidimicrobiia bacterium]|nr:c-type cytochrome [Acidimicrobiia bacterium]